MAAILYRAVTSFEEWREAARPLLSANVAPGAVQWGHALALPAAAATGDVQETAGADRMSGAAPHSGAPRISASLLRLLQGVADYRHPGRWELMYRLTWRSINDNPRLLEDAADADVHGATMMEKAVARDVHKMHAFVRFREVLGATGEAGYVAWFEPEHEILRRGASFFVKRFPNMQWTLATPDGAAVWSGAGELKFIDAPAAANLPTRDDYEGLWRTYYRSICNVARINPAAMQREMPQRYWKNLPEAAEIPSIMRDGMSDFVKRHRESTNEGMTMAKAVKRALAPPAVAGETPESCRRCDLWQQATQAVNGEGPTEARIMLVGEQPGDEEDLRGQPFVGPAGKVLDQALAAAGLERTRVFITNAVKHFKWEPRGKRRLHKKPAAGEINACNIWLQREIAAVKPVVIVALGATALRALGTTSSIDGARQQELTHASGARILATYHPSAILRSDGERVEELRAHLEKDLRKAGEIAE